MNRILSAVFIIVLSSHTDLNAQLFQDVKVGLKAGANYNEVKGQDFTSNFSRNWHLGGYLQLQGKKIGLGSEIIFDRSIYELQNVVASNFSGTVRDTSDHSTSLTISKYQIPVYLSYKASIFQFQLGMVFEGFLNFKDKEQFFNSVNTVFSKNAKSLMAGIWLDVTKKINFGGRYIYGLEKISSSQINDAWKSREIQLHIGYRLL